MKKFEWRQIDWFEADGKVIFDDAFGFVRVQAGKTMFHIASPQYGQRINLLNCFYIGQEDTKVQLNQSNYTGIFSREIYVIDHQNPKKIDVDALHIKIFCVPISDPRYVAYERSCSAEIIINRENFSAHPRQVWICEEIQNMSPEEIFKLFQRPLFLDLQIGQSVFHKNLGKCTIVKIYEEPDMEDRMIDIQATNQEVRTIKFSGSDSDAVYKIPYQAPLTSELDQFNVRQNEIQLSPYALFADKQINIFWRQLTNAARYIISLYRRYERPYLQGIYHLKDYIVERGEGYLPIKDLLGRDYIVVLKAEDRSGEIIAQSRGIDLSGIAHSPKFWN